MPKNQYINPSQVRKTQVLELGSIPVNTYNKGMKEELSRFSKEDLMRIYRDMLIIREFETMLNLIKTKDEYKGIPYAHPGPAHLSIGQEAAAVGMAYKLDIDDFIFGSHRSHGEILAKGLSAIQKLDDDALHEIMKNFFDGRILSIVEKGHKGDMKGGLPIIFNIMNNQYGMGGQTCGETMGYSIAARVGAALNSENMHTERVDGYNPLAVIDAYERKMQILEEKKGPVFLDVLTYRYSGHSPSDSSSYRSKEEVEAWEKEDSIISYGLELISSGIAGQSDLDQIKNDIDDLLLGAFKLSIDDEVSPRMNLVANPELIGDMMFSNGSVDAMEEGPLDTLLTMEENPRVKQIARKERYAYDENGKAYSGMKQYQFRDGIFEAVVDRFYKDSTLLAYGEENRDWGGAFAVYRGLTEALPYHRLFNSPISEGAIVGTAIGYAMCGGRVIPEIMYCDFLGRSGDEVFNQLPKWQAMSGNLIKMPVVLRVSVGSKYGAQHSQDWSSLVAHIPGIKVVFPATPYDAKGLMNAALQGTDPVIYFESQRLYGIGEEFHKEGVPEEYYEISIGEPDVKRAGEDVTILTIGASLYRAMEAADQLQEKYGMSAEIIDARSLVPFNYELVLESLKKTGRIVLVSDASERGSYLKDLAQNITELGFDDLDAPPVVVGSRNWITPAYELEDYFFPQASWILDAIHERIVPLQGHVCTSNYTAGEKLRRSKLGI
ncbi:MAG: thiamine pyrophosphate-dependent enzyme [Bacteroides sp.]|nr:thiamine pyrophosphate-dependent enzyme [Bacteroides sp.]